nr:transposase (putative), gypsy type [Tanacetum cinerariifolium]
MSAITDVRCVLTQEALDAFCNTFHIPEKVHVLPNQDDTMHERPAGKIKLYTRFFGFANFRLPLSTFLVDILRHFRINICQLSLLRRPSSKAFMCLVGLSLHYTLDEETYLRFVHKNGDDMDLFAFTHAPDPTKVRVVERERDEGEPRLLETTVGRTVLLLSVAHDCAESELKSSVDRLFNEGGSGHQTEQGDSAGDGQDANIQPAVEAADTIVEDAAPCNQDFRGRENTWLWMQAGLPVGVAAIPTLPFVTASVSTTPEREDGDHTNSVAEPNLGTIGAPRRFVISSNSSHHSGTNVAEAEVDSLIRSSALIMTTVTTTTPTVDPTSVTKYKVVEPSLFGAGSSSAGETDPITCVFSDLTGSDFLMVDEFSPLKFFASVRGMEHDQLFIEFNVGAARQTLISAEMRMRVEYNVKEKKRLKYAVESQAELLKAREEEIDSLKTWLLLKEVKAAEAIRLRAEASNFETVENSLRDEANALREPMSKERELTDLNTLVTSIKSQNDSFVGQVHELEISSSGLQEKVKVYENCMERLEKFQDDRMKIVEDKWLLTHGMELTIAKCLNSSEYLSALETAIGEAIEKGMQDGLAAGITHGKEGRVLTDVFAHNPSEKADYIFALQQLQNVNFPLFAKLKSNKDASVEAIMDILRLEDHVAEKLGLNELQLNVEQLMVPIHSSPDKVVIGASALSLALDVSSVEGTFGTVPATATTTALSTTLALTNTFNPISIDDYEFVDADDQAVAGGDATSFPNVDDAELYIPQ